MESYCFFLLTFCLIYIYISCTLPPPCRTPCLRLFLMSYLNAGFVHWPECVGTDVVVSTPQLPTHPLGSCGFIYSCDILSFCLIQLSALQGYRCFRSQTHLGCSSTDRTPATQTTPLISLISISVGALASDWYVLRRPTITLQMLNKQHCFVWFSCSTELHMHLHWGHEKGHWSPSGIDHFIVSFFKAFLASYASCLTIL